MRCHACEIGDTGCGGIVANRFCPWCGRKLCETRMEMAR